LTGRISRMEADERVLLGTLGLRHGAALDALEHRTDCGRYRFGKDDVVKKYWRAALETGERLVFTCKYLA